MFAKVPGIWILLCMIQFFILTTNIHQSKMVYGHGHFWSDFSLIKPPGDLVPFWDPFTPLAVHPSSTHPSTSPLGRGMGWLQLRKGPLALGAIVDSLKTVPSREGSWHIPLEGKGWKIIDSKGLGSRICFFSTGGNYCNSSASVQELQLPKGN